MLISEPFVEHACSDPIAKMIAQINGNQPGAVEITTGVYQIGHFVSRGFLPGYEDYPEKLSIGCYGVCDSHHQVLAQCPELADPDRRFVVTLTEVRREDQGEGGWRWHKWGYYIGDHEIQHEYLYDEEGIERVFCYHIYEAKR